MTDFEKFIIAHENDDTAALLLAAKSNLAIDIRLAVNTIECRKKLKNKVPQWQALTSLIYPDQLCSEQCSSSETARYKASLAARIMGRKGKIADLTGGLGVDSWAFSYVARQVLYNEMKPELAEAASNNFKELGINNILISNESIGSGKIVQVLDGFKADIIYMDPSRRKSSGKKVFIIEDCEPDILSIKEELAEACPNILVKLSPMADISLAVSKLGLQVREVHIVGAQGECKELLIWLDKNWEGEYKLFVYDSGPYIIIHPGDEKKASADFLQGGEPLEGKILREPGKALMKSGYYNGLCKRFGLKKLGVSTHLYISQSLPKELEGLCKIFKIKEFMPMNNKNIRDLGKAVEKGEVSSKNIPLNSEALRKKIGIKPGEGPHIFGAKIDSHGNCLIIAERLKYDKSCES